MRRRALFWSSMSVHLALGLAPASARAEAASPLVLTWDAPPECPPRAEVEASVARLLAGSRSPDPLEGDVKVTIDRRGVYRARLRTRLGGVRGERSLAAASCALVASATVLVLALTIDPTLAVEPPRDEPPAPPPREPPPPAPEPAAVEPAPPSPPRDSARTSAEVGVAALLDVGLLPSPAPGVEADLGVGRGWVSLVAAAAIFAPESKDADARAGTGGRFTLLAASLRACAGSGGTLRVDACAGVELDRLRAEGFGVSSPGSATRLWLAPRAGTRLEWRPVSFLSVPLTADVLVPLDRPTFALDNVGPVFRPSSLAFRASIGVALHFE